MANRSVTWPTMPRDSEGQGRDPGYNLDNSSGQWVAVNGAQEIT